MNNDLNTPADLTTLWHTLAWSADKSPPPPRPGAKQVIARAIEDRTLPSYRVEDTLTAIAPTTMWSWSGLETLARLANLPITTAMIAHRDFASGGPGLPVMDLAALVAVMDGYWGLPINSQLLLSTAQSLLPKKRNAWVTPSELRVKWAKAERDKIRYVIRFDPTERMEVDPEIIITPRGYRYFRSPECLAIAGPRVRKKDWAWYEKRSRI